MNRLCSLILIIFIVDGCGEQEILVSIKEITAHNGPAGPSATHGWATVETLFGEIKLQKVGQETNITTQFVPYKLIGRHATVTLSRGEAKIVGDAYYFQCALGQRQFNNACGFVDYDPNIRIQFRDSSGSTFIAHGTIKRGKTIMSPDYGANPKYWRVWGTK